MWIKLLIFYNIIFQNAPFQTTHIEHSLFCVWKPWKTRRKYIEWGPQCIYYITLKITTIYTLIWLHRKFLWMNSPSHSNIHDMIALPFSHYLALSHTFHFVSLKKNLIVCTFLHLFNFLLHKCTSHLDLTRNIRRSRGSVKNENRYKRKENCRFINKIEQMENHFVFFFFQKKCYQVNKWWT